MIVKKILVPTDLSVNSKTGASYAISLAHQYRAELVLLHVTFFSVYSFAASWEAEAIYGQPAIQLILDDALREARRDLSRFVQGHLSDGLGDLKYTLRVGSGDVSDEIVSAACQEEVDLIVMAKRDLRWFRRLLSHSVSEAVSREAPCPVLSICPPQIARPWRGDRVPMARTLQTFEA